MTDDRRGRTKPMKRETFFRLAVGSMVTWVVILAAAYAWAQPDDAEPLAPSVFAVAVIADSMEETRSQAVELPAGYLRVVCTWEGLDPTLRDAYEILVDDPLFARWVREWRGQYWAGLTACAKGDLPRASAHLTPAFEAADKMMSIASRG